MYTKIKRWFMKLFTKPKQAPIVDRVEPVADVEPNLRFTLPEPPPMRYVKDDKVRKELPKTAPKSPQKKSGTSSYAHNNTTQSDTNNLFTQAVIASVILSDNSDTDSKSTTPSASDYGCSPRSSSSSSSYDSCSSSSDSSSSSSSGCD